MSASSELFLGLVRAGQEALRVGDAVGASQLLEQALAAGEARFGASSTELIDPLVLLGKALRTARHTESALGEAVAAQERALAIAEQHADRRLSQVLSSLANTYELQHEFERAIVCLTRSLEIERSQSWDVRFTLMSLTHVLLNAARPHEALAYAEEALRLAQESASSEAELIAPIIDVGLCLRASGRALDALSSFKRAHRIATARADVPELRAARRTIEAEIESWIVELETEVHAKDDSNGPDRG